MTSYFIINGIEYDKNEALVSPPIGAVLVLNEAWQVTPKTINEAFRKMSLDETDDVEFGYSAEFIHAFAGMIFLGRSRAGEVTTLEEALSVAFTDVTYRSDEPVVVEPDPKAPSSAPDVEGEPDPIVPTILS